MQNYKYDSIERSTLALAMALGEDVERIQKRIQNESEICIYKTIYQELLNKRRIIFLEKGEWARDLIDLKSYIFSVDLCARNPQEEKKAYQALQLFLKMKHINKNGLANWEFIVDDPAFGKMSLSMEGGDIK